MGKVKFKKKIFFIPVLFKINVALKLPQNLYANLSNFLFINTKLIFTSGKVLFFEKNGVTFCTKIS
jgi:hypothetical protein